MNRAEDIDEINRQIDASVPKDHNYKRKFAIALSGFMGLAFQEINNEIKVSDYNILLRANVRDEKAYNK